MFQKTLLLFFFCSFLATLSIAQEKPDWLNGKWTGTIAWEHDTTEYQVELTFKDSLNNSQIFYSTLNCTGSLAVDSTSREFAYFEETILDTDKQCHPFGHQIILSEIDDSGILHVQYRGNKKLGFGQLKKVK